MIDYTTSYATMKFRDSQGCPSQVVPLVFLDFADFCGSFAEFCGFFSEFCGFLRIFSEFVRDVGGIFAEFRGILRKVCGILRTNTKGTRAKGHQCEALILSEQVLSEQVARAMNCCDPLLLDVPARSTFPTPAHAKE